uniref:TSC22 domain family, member 2 n=1 Tax=Mola mola TaxID=94237 RepID=A0A3Q3X093_MOLML
MSKMPAKKKSCFQITSVTQAQVAAIGATDDTESLEDPDESRTEDVSSEIYDMSRAEYDPACDRSSSEEALNNVGEPEAISGMAPSHVPQPSQPSALSGNPIAEFRKGGPGAVQQQASPAATAVTSFTTPATSTVSCTSRFRVIKLDHGIGEPFRRGRWTCTEFYEKDSEGSASVRTVDNIRHAGAALEPAADRDSGLGHTGGSVAAPSTHSGQGLGSVADASLSSSRMHVLETVQHPSYSARPQGKSPIMPPSAQPMTYPPQLQQQQLPIGHHLTSQSDYYQKQQPTSVQPGLATGQTHPALSLSAGTQSVGQGPGSVLPSASGGASVPSQVGDVAGAGGGTVTTGQPATRLLQQHVQNVPAIAVSSSVPATVPTAVPSASSAVMPNVTTSGLPPGFLSHSKTSVALGAQGLPSAGFGHVEGGGGGMSEGLVSAQSPVVSGKEGMKPLMPESLQLATPTVNSLFGIHISVDGDVDRASGTNVAAIDNKIEQAMDLVKSHLMYAVREEVEVLKEQIKELYERNSVLERENAVLKSLANSEQLSQLSTQSTGGSVSTPPQQGLSQHQQPKPNLSQQK